MHLRFLVYFALDRQARAITSVFPKVTLKPYCDGTSCRAYLIWRGSTTFQENRTLYMHSATSRPLPREIERKGDRNIRDVDWKTNF